MTTSTCWLVTGAGGQLGSVLLRELASRDERAVGLTSPTGPRPFEGRTVAADVTDREHVAEIVREARPSIVIHAAAMTAVDACYRNADAARRTNVEATQALLESAQACGARFVFISTDLVFEGAHPPYREEDPPVPLSVYGRTKVEAEKRVLDDDKGLVIRPPLMYGLPAAKRKTTFTQQLIALCTGQALRLFEDEFRTPMSLVDCARACIEAARSPHRGILHVAGPERLSRLEIGRIAARSLGCDGANIVPIRQSDVSFPEPRPADVSLDGRKFEALFGHPSGRSMSLVMPEIAAQWRSWAGAFA